MIGVSHCIHTGLTAMAILGTVLHSVSGAHDLLQQPELQQISETGGMIYLRGAPRAMLAHAGKVPSGSPSYPALSITLVVCCSVAVLMSIAFVFSCFRAREADQPSQEQKAKQQPPYEQRSKSAQLPISNSTLEGHSSNTVPAKQAKANSSPALQHVSKQNGASSTLHHVPSDTKFSFASLFTFKQAQADGVAAIDYLKRDTAGKHDQSKKTGPRSEPRITIPDQAEMLNGHKNISPNGTYGHGSRNLYGVGNGSMNSTRTPTATHGTFNTVGTSCHDVSIATKTDSSCATATRTQDSRTQPASGVVDMPAMVQGHILKSLALKWEDILLGGVVGQGGFGKVHKGRWQGNKVAVKMLNLEKAGPEVRVALQQEALIMSELRHPCIARVYGLVDEEQHQAIVMQYYRYGTLAKARTSIWFTSLAAADRLRLALQVASGMNFLHERSFIHGDLKSSNLLFEEDGSTRRRLVIADFGLASSLGASEQQALTVSISPPEVLQNPKAPRTAAADVYAFSMVLLELMTGRPPFAGMSAQMLKMSVCQGMRPTIPPFVPAEVTKIIESCWAQDPAQRPTFAQVLPQLEAAAREHQQATMWADTTTMMMTNM